MWYTTWIVWSGFFVLFDVVDLFRKQGGIWHAAWLPCVSLCVIVCFWRAEAGSVCVRMRTYAHVCVEGLVWRVVALKIIEEDLCVS